MRYPVLHGGADEDRRRAGAAADLSVYLTRVKKGQALTVTEHGRAVAELRPLQVEADPLARLIAEGRVTPARRAPSALPRPLRPRLERPISALLDDLRGDSI